MRFDAIIFDIDNVLIDTRASYIDCIIKTVTLYLETVFEFRSSRVSLLNRKDIEAFKSLGGFNDDWDTCYGLLLYLLSLKVKRKTIFELKKKQNVVRLSHEIKGKPLGTGGAGKIFGLNPNVTAKKIADIFQRFYLTEFMWNEQLIIPASFLKQIKKLNLKTGIVTGRSCEEADFVLRRFQIDRYFDAMITADNTPANRKKPNPWGLLKIADKLGKKLKYLYVGDLPDDVLAAKQARKKINISSCGFLAVSNLNREMKKELRKIKADYICSSVKELKEIILPIHR